MKSILFAGVAALGLMFAGSPSTAEAGTCYGGGYGYSPGYYGGGYGGYGYAPIRRAPVYTPVRRSRSFYGPGIGAGYPYGIYGRRGFRGYPGVYGRRGGVSLSFGF